MKNPAGYPYGNRDEQKIGAPAGQPLRLDRRQPSVLKRGQSERVGLGRLGSGSDKRDRWLGPLLRTLRRIGGSNEQSPRAGLDGQDEEPYQRRRLPSRYPPKVGAFPV